MPRSASTAERTETIINNLTSPNCMADVYLEIYNNGSWQVLDDVDMNAGITWTESGKKEKFANYSLTPLPGTISFTVYNENGKYFPGSGQPQDGIIDTDTKVRLSAGYMLDTGSSATYTLNLNDVAGSIIKSFFYKMDHSGGTVILDSDGSESITHFQDLFDTFYGGSFYGAINYTPACYTVQTYDTNTPGLITFDKISITANNTKGLIYFRTFDDKEVIDTSYSTQWTYGGLTVNGTTTIDFANIDNKRFIQVAVMYDGINWDESLIISGISVIVTTKFETMYTSVYYLDQPKFNDPKAPQMPMINCDGRDIFKKAIGIDIKYSDVTNLYIDDIIKSICDKVGIGYSASSIADLTSFGQRLAFTVGNEKVAKADVLLDQCMQIINPTGYVMYTQYDSTADDNILYVQPLPTISDVTGVFSYKNYESIGDVAKNGGKVLQRMTVITNEESTEDEMQLDTEAISTTGAKSLTWAGGAIFKRITADYPNNITISNLVVETTSISFTVDSISGTVNITAYGCKYPGDAPRFEGEAINFDNMTFLEGNTNKLVNPLCKTDSECKSIAESFINNFGNPVFEAKSLKWPYLNLIPTLNDAYMMWRRFVGGTSADEIYRITKITHRFNKSRTPTHTTEYNLDDSGFKYSDLGEFIYDSIMNYDKGFVYDMGISTPLSSDAQIDAATIIVHDIDC